MSKNKSEFLNNRKDNQYEVVIGLEVHAQITSESKLFSTFSRTWLIICVISADLSFSVSAPDVLDFLPRFGAMMDFETLVDAQWGHNKSPAANWVSKA